jgi:hypothetical protein
MNSTRLERELDRRREHHVLVLAAARTLVSFLPFTGFTIRSLSREWMPITMPRKALAGRDEHAAALLEVEEREGDRIALLREISTPFLRVGSSPFTGAYFSNTWLLMPVPRVSVMNSMWKPIRPRDGML